MRMMLKMAAVALLLLCCFVIASTDCDFYAAEGQNIDVPLTYKLTESDRLKWFHDSRVLFDRKSKVIIQGNVNDVHPNGSLRLTNVKKSSAGKYISEVYSSEGVKQKTKDTAKDLCILDDVPKPTVKIECKAANVIFSCTVNKQTQGLTFEWIKNKVVLKMKPSQTLNLKAKEVKTDSFQCKVSNPASSRISEPVTQTCKVSIFPDDLFGFDFWIMVGILAGGGGLVLVLIIVVIVCCVRARRKRGMKVKDEEEFRLGWANPEQQHQRHHHQHHHHEEHTNLHPNHHHHHQQQPAGHTGPRQPRSKQHREPRSKVPPTPSGQPEPSPRRAAQPPRPVTTTDDEQPPPLPQPRKKAPRTPRV